MDNGHNEKCRSTSRCVRIIYIRGFLSRKKKLPEGQKKSGLAKAARPPQQNNLDNS